MMESPDATVSSDDTQAADSSTAIGKHQKKQQETLLSATGGSSASEGFFYSPASSTPLPVRPAEVRVRASRIVISANWEEFETGRESRFARGIQELVRQHPGAGVDAISELILASQVDGEAAWEALRWLGYLAHTPSRAARLWLLEQALESPSAKVRDGAALGLAAIDDPHAIPALRRAISAERIPELREDLIQVVAQLESTARCPSS